MAQTKAGPRSSYATVNPYTNEVVREFTSLRGEEIDRAIERAHRALEPWRQRGAAERAEVVGRAAVLMRERYEELARTITLEMGKLILTDRDKVGLVQENVGGLQDRVSEEPKGRQISIGDLLLFLFIGRVTLQPRNGRDHREEQMQDGMIGIGGLDEDRGFIGVDAHCEPVDEHLMHKFPDARCVGIVRRESVPVRDEEKTVVLIL